MRIWPKNLPFLSAFIAGLCFIAGMVLGIAVNALFFGISILSILMPDILREMHLLNDMDEFRLTASRRAGEHAYIFAGVFIYIIMVLSYEGLLVEVHTWEILAFILLLIFVVKFTSYFFQFWDKTKAAFKLLLIIGIFWLVFILMNGIIWKGEISALRIIEIMAFPSTFLMLALLALKLPRVTGIICLLIAAGSMIIFFYRFRSVIMKVHYRRGF